MSRRPVGFILCSHAATCDPGTVSYEQLWSEINGGSIVIDPNLSHEGEWLLDHAIQARLASQGGLRAFRANRGADPSMDALWAMWMSQASEDILGGEIQQADRAAFLIRAGSSACLDVALSRGMAPAVVGERWKAQRPGVFHSDPVLHCVKGDLFNTTRILLDRGFLASNSPSGNHPLLAAKSADMLELLLQAGADPRAIASPGLVDGLLSREVASQELGKMLDILNATPGMENSPADHVRRMAAKLDKKSLEQFRVEMRAAHWSPAVRMGMASPIVAWARQSLHGTAHPDAASTALAWLGKQASVSRPQPGEGWSEAAWIWAALFPGSPTAAEKFAAIACDMPQAGNNAERVAFFHAFTQSNDLPRRVEDAISAQFNDLPWHGDQGKRDAATAKLDAWFGTDGDDWLLSLYRRPSRQNVDPLAWHKLFDGKDQQLQRSQVMALACWICLVQDNPRLSQEVADLWAVGERPLDSARILHTFGPLLSGRRDPLAASIEAWILDRLSCQSQGARPSPRL